MYKVFVAIFAVVVFCGCGVSEEVVNKKIETANREIMEKVSRDIAALDSSVKGDISKIEKNYLTQKEYKEEIGEMKAQVNKNFSELKKIVDKLEALMGSLQIANKEEIQKVMQDVKSATNAYWKMLSAQKEALERAMRELEKLSFPESAVPAKGE